MPAIARPHSQVSVLALLAVCACGSNTDITRSDDDVEKWVAEQQAAEKDRHVRPSALGQAPPAATAAEPPAAAPAAPATTAAAPTPCSREWYARVEAQVHVTDAQGHGPDLGSEEWKSAVEQRLGIADDTAFPELGTPDWCDAIDRRTLQH